MVISSIDLKDGKVVQLKNGKDKVLERDYPLELISDFNKYGEVAVIDLDAALRNITPKGTTANTEILKSLLRHGNVRVGGGIRDVKRAKELISLGAEKVIVGSAAFNANPTDGNIRNTAFLDELVAAIGRQRIIISVDAINGVIAIKGWTETAGIPLVDGAKAAEKYASELLFTCVEREGCMTGTNMELVRQLREAVSCRLVVAGGVSSLDEIVELIVETVCAKRKTTRIAGSDFPHEIVRSRFLKLDNSHIEFVMDCLQKNTTEIRNMKQYLLTVLFNAPTTISNHYTSQVNHDLYGGW